MVFKVGHYLLETDESQLLTTNWSKGGNGSRLYRRAKDSVYYVAEIKDFTEVAATIIDRAKAIKFFWKVNRDKLNFRYVFQAAFCQDFVDTFTTKKKKKFGISSRRLRK